MKQIIKNFILWLIILFFSISVFYKYNLIRNFSHKVDYSTFLVELNSNKIKYVTIQNRKIKFIENNNNKYNTYIPFHDSKLLYLLISKNVRIVGNPKILPGILFSIFISWFPIFLFILSWVIILKKFQKNNKSNISFSKNKAKLFLSNNINITLKDVAGCDEAKEEIKDIIDFLKDPYKFQKLGAIIPKGILMVGPTGTGKTLLAKAIAGESKVPFFNISGSDFVEMFVGVGASRVRNMFKEAKKKEPCIIFIDEIDTVGRQRSYNNFNGSNDEREQTLNQMLVEMDGFDKNQGIIVIGATNRPHILDKALLRPGRFDRKISIDLPNVYGREQILKIHFINKSIDKNIDIFSIAKNTPGFSGADLANLVNEAILLAVRQKKEVVSIEHFETAKDKIIMGVEKKSLVITNKQKECTAFHESGHVIVGYLMPEHDPIHKVTIIPRGDALGMTFFTQRCDVVSVNKQKLESRIAALYGGRVAEEIIYGKNYVSTGSSNDIKVATNLARDMVTKWGFSNRLGPLFCAEKDNNFIFENTKIRTISNITNNIIDEEIKLFINKNYNIARKILNNNIDILKKMKDSLLKYETIDAVHIKKIMTRKK
ncbi:ATP-dependent zinc metalloprotease FtsH [Candidatus Annandia adelgestsuga]|uniref:ATP-dependent zinc metalloprotease FtsH n=1 Tax=Candidatus Annandia adelgestsuga TaxID=1302411 RepID=A0A3Q9CLE6_9ENTR|nr:ATP-dependent zinc metalloprotease FtsH [Candidatus Annandia adelgestsuga]AZP36305.1 ATP-dependent zinc metalloprotease FtsH [Candidatus Annandia adelgestsuga]